MESLRYFLTKFYDDIGYVFGYRKLGRIRYFLERFNENVYYVSDGELISNQIINKEIRSLSEWNELVENHNSKILNKIGISKMNLRKRKKIIIPGVCGVCGSQYGFLAPVEINQLNSCREVLGCISCRRVRRERVILERIKHYYDTGKQKIYMYEAGGNYRLVKSYAKDAIGSEYISSDIRSGEIVNGVLHEDAHNLSFADETFDVVVSRDVFEHISDVAKCLQEAFRVLRGGGICIVSIPWNPQVRESHQRAEIKDGKIIYLDEPVYHWNPITQSMDSLVFWDYGWDFLDYMRRVGFRDAYIQAYYDKSRGYLGEIGSYFVGKK